MDHLKVEFHEDLASPNTEAVRVEEGFVHIREWNWPAHEVLQAMGTDAYDQAFKNWRDERRETLLAKAEETLNAYDQTDRFERLKDSYLRGMVMPFVGAGMSMPSGYLGWTAFLRRLRADAGIDEAQFEALLSAGSYERAAQEVADALGVGFNERVESRFGANRDLRGPVQFLPFVFPQAAVITTNFDEVVSRCYRARDELAFEDELTGLGSDELPRYLAQGRRVLVRLHGAASRARERVLTQREYDAAYAEADTLPRAIRSICSRTLLFLGCSLSVDRVLSALQAYVDAEGHERTARHYAFLAAPDADDDRRNKERALERLNIYPIWYPPNEDDESIEGYFYRLADQVRNL